MADERMTADQIAARPDHMCVGYPRCGGCGTPTFSGAYDDDQNHDRAAQSAIRQAYVDGYARAWRDAKAGV